MYISFILQVVPSELDTSLPGKEFSMRTIRAVLARLNRCKEFILDRFLNNKSQTTTTNNIQQQMQQKYRDEMEIYDLYQGLLSRDKILYDLRLDIYELKCAFIQFVDGKQPIPSKPKYYPLPKLDIHLPTEPVACGQKHREKVSGKGERRTDNEMFHSLIGNTIYEDNEIYSSETSEENAEFETLEVANVIYKEGETKDTDVDESCILA